MNKSPMKGLRDKLLSEVENLKEPSKSSSYLKAYREALINTLNDIENYMIKFERIAIVEAYNTDLYGGLSGNRKFSDGDEYYKETYGD